MTSTTQWLATGFETGNRARFPTYVVLGIAVGVFSAVLILVPQVRSLEQSLGLGWLFRMRGPLAAPDGVVLVTISREAAANIFLPQDPEKFHRCEDFRTGARPATHVSLPSLPARWPRCLHALLVDKLTQAGVRTVAFDVLFRSRPALPGSAGDLNAEQDLQLAAALARSRRVLVANKLESSQIRPSKMPESGAEELIEISPAILDAALGHAPFPVIEHRGRLDEFLVFTQGASATPSLPVLAMQAYSLDLYPQFRDMLTKLAPEQAGLLPATLEDVRSLGQLQATCLLLRQLFIGNPGLAEQMRSALASGEWAGLDTGVRKGLNRLLALYAGPDARLLNLLGPAGTFRVYGYDQALTFNEEQSRAAFSSKMVFVGYAEMLRPEQMEHFATVFSSVNGVALSGIEVAATALDNFLNDSSIRHAGLSLWMLVTLLAGTLATLCSLLLTNRCAIPLAVLLVGGYIWAALVLFAGRGLWLPLMLPAGIAAPLGLATGTIWKYRIARQQRETIRNAFMKLVPREVVEELERNAGNFSATRQSIECACVVTDAANFTLLGEALTSEDLADFLNRYFDMLFRPVARHGGFVSDIVGDAMLAIWPDRSPDARDNMLSALLEMREAARLFDEHPTAGGLQTRFGVDWGHVTLTMIGSPTHYEYRAVGDPVNTATRIQELNKKLGTRVLVSLPALGDANRKYLVRDLGLFLLRGKTRPVQLSELIGLRDAATDDQLTLCRRFEAGIELLRSGKMADALTALREILVEFPRDQVTAYFVQRLETGAAWVNGALKAD